MVSRITARGTSYASDTAPTDGPAFGPFGDYASFEGTLEKLIATGDMLDGERVYLAGIGPESLDDNQIAMTVTFPNSAAVYGHTDPRAPATLALTITACGFVALVAYRQSRSALPRRT